MLLYDYAASANCYKVRLLLALLGRDDVERVPVDIFAGETMTEAFAAMNPARETPVLALDDGTVITQSNAILWLLADGTGFLPATPVARAQVLQWLFFEQEYVMSGIGSARFMAMTDRNPAALPARVALGERALAALQEGLHARSFLVGDACSIADLSIFAYTHVAEDAGFRLADYPAVSAWLRRITMLPRYQDDLTPYPDNARPGASRSIYDG